MWAEAIDPERLEKTQREFLIDRAERAVDNVRCGKQARVPSLVPSWYASANGNTWTFTLLMQNGPTGSPSQQTMPYLHSSVHYCQVQMPKVQDAKRTRTKRVYVVPHCERTRYQYR